MKIPTSEGAAVFYVIMTCIVGFFAVAIVALASMHDSIPKCQEDEIIVGNGDYSHGKWDWYSCAHKDTLWEANQ